MPVFEFVSEFCSGYTLVVKPNFLHNILKSNSVIPYDLFGYRWDHCTTDQVQRREFCSAVFLV